MIIKEYNSFLNYFKTKKRPEIDLEWEEDEHSFQYWLEDKRNSMNGVEIKNPYFPGTKYKLDISENGLTDLIGIEKYNNLKELEVYRNSIGDLSPVSKLTELRSLSVFRNNISSIKPLIGLKKLQTLVLSRNSINTIDGIENCKSLSFLGISHNNLSNMDCLYGHKNIERIFCHNNNIENFDFIKSLPKLMEITISDNPFSEEHVTSIIQYCKENKILIKA